jgi:hypothetical protein
MAEERRAMIRVLIWATHLQTDILALASYLDTCEDVALLVVTPGLEAFLQEPFVRARPFRAQLLDRDDPGALARVRAFAADVAVADNHVPPKGTAPRLFYMWHGLGWKARGALDLKVFYRQVKRMIGSDPRAPGAPFMAQCYGPGDRAWRIENWGLPAAACAEIGMTFSDLLLAPPYSKADIASRYKIDVIGRRTVMLSITWHYGGVFATAPSPRRTLQGLAGRRPTRGQDTAFLERMIQTVRARGANLLVCLHDRKRYDPEFVQAIMRLQAEHAFMEVRFKDEHPDNLSDLLVADVMVSNLSSFLAYYYVLGGPAVHILPVDRATGLIERRIMVFSRFRLRAWKGTRAAWMLDPRDIGGPAAADGDEAIAAVTAALNDPALGAADAASWLERHVVEMDGHTARRFKEQLVQFCARPLSSSATG